LGVVNGFLVGCKLVLGLIDFRGFGVDIAAGELLLKLLIGIAIELGVQRSQLALR